LVMLLLKSTLMARHGAGLWQLRHNTGKTRKMRDVRKSEFGHAGRIAPRVAIANSLGPPRTEKSAFLPKPVALSS
jgi:hypothetical protein